MSTNEWRGPEELRDPRREFIRRHLPSGSNGFIAEDLDLVLRTYGSNFHQDADGCLMLVELKTGIGTFGVSKRKTLGLFDDICRRSEMVARYRGFYVVYSPTNDWETETTFRVNGHTLDQNEFIGWMLGIIHVDPVRPCAVPSNIANWHVGALEANS